MEFVTFTETIGKSEKLCFDCKTSKTPLWRSGPAGPKSLCNACGIRFRKKKGVTGSDNKQEKHYPSSPQSPSPSLTSSATDDNTMGSRKREMGDLRKKLRVKVVAMGREAVVLQRPRSPVKKVRRIESEYTMKKMKFGEVEEAAYLLMCLSYG